MAIALLIGLTFSSKSVFSQLIDQVDISYRTGEGSKTGFDKQTLKLIDKVEEIEPSIKDKLLSLAHAIIRDAKTGKTYS